MTSAGRPALDVPAAVGLALAELGVDLEDEHVCTACDTRYFSHRARGDVGRQVLMVWLEPAG
jgi:copper oxidase (laccase) domain-containing protein